MAYRMTLPSAAAKARRTYDNLSGVDFANSGAMISTSRSGEAVNVYRDYSATGGKAMQTRPGFARRVCAEGAINGVHIFEDTALIHHGTNLSLWSTFPETAAAQDLTAIDSGMADARSVSFVFDEKLYILDGAHYAVYDETSLSEVAAQATVPVTRISANPDGSDGSAYQAVNMLTPERKNTFVSDGASTVYHLDVEEADAEGDVRVWIDGEEVQEGFTLNSASGTVTFETAPAAPPAAGTANVEILFSRTVADHAGRVTGCRIARVFDGRVFLSGNPAYKGAVIHSALGDAAYFPDTAYYNDGEGDTDVRALLIADGKLLVLKGEGGAETKLYAHTPSLDYDDGKVYPVEPLSVTAACKSCAAPFMGCAVYLSRLGAESVYLSGDTLSVDHISALIDKKLTALSGYASAGMCVWNNYLVIVADGMLFLADGLNPYTENGSAAYEWFWWKDIGVYESEVFHAAQNVFSYEGGLFFTTDSGAVCAFGGTNDDGRAFESAWVTPPDDFGDASAVKKIVKTGGVARIKRIPNSVVRVAYCTDKTAFQDIKNVRTAGFTFDTVDFSRFTFGTGLSGRIVYRIDAGKVEYISLKFYSDEKDKPFGLYDAALQAEKKNEIK